MPHPHSLQRISIFSQAARRNEDGYIGGQKRSNPEEIMPIPVRAKDPSHDDPKHRISSAYQISYKSTVCGGWVNGWP
jgi:hypothetical protein